jgi:bacillithiol system protein YtxJ
MNWISLTDEAQLTTIKELSGQKPQVIFKHSTRCSISSVVKNRLERSSSPNADFYYLDLLRYRHLSDKIADNYKVYHESPQLLLIVNGDCIYEESHLSISMDEITAQLV